VIHRRLSKTAGVLEHWEAVESPKARIVSFIRILLSNQTKIMAFGCPVGTLTTELAKLDHIAQSHAAEIFTLFRDWLAKQFRTLGHGDESTPLALHLLGRSQGIAVMASAYRDESYLETEVAALEEWLGTLIDKPSLKD
jgi:TetR/AcrR family transcriptional regulator, transcriptional repressor for nem operon